MRVLQLIDSLNLGGAERMAVSFANELALSNIDSFLCATRAEGDMKINLLAKVNYLFLDKKGIFDFEAFKKLKRFVVNNEITIIHAHSSSFFFATLLKLVIPSLTLIWHDHYGNSEMLANRNYRILKFCSLKFNAIIAVNDVLKYWSESRLSCNNVFYLPNFVSLNSNSNFSVLLNGDESFRIVCVANMRPQKDHITLLDAFVIVKSKIKKASLHLIGNCNNDFTSESILSKIEDEKIKDVFVLGSQQNVAPLLKQAKIGVLSSVSEGLPVSLLEYGIVGLPVVCTDVGQCKEVVRDFGKVVAKRNSNELADAIIYYLENNKKAQIDGESFHNHIRNEYSFKKINKQLFNIYKTA